MKTRPPLVNRTAKAVYSSERTSSVGARYARHSVLGLWTLIPGLALAQFAVAPLEPLGPKMAIYQSAVNDNVEAALRQLDQLTKPGESEAEQNLHRAFDRARIARLFYERGQFERAKSLARTALLRVSQAIRAERDPAPALLDRARAISSYIIDHLLDGQSPIGTEAPPGLQIAVTGIDGTSFSTPLTPIAEPDSGLPRFGTFGEWVPGGAPSFQVQPAADGQLLLRLDRPGSGNWVIERSSDLIHWQPVATLDQSDAISVANDGSPTSFFRIRSLNQ